MGRTLSWEPPDGLVKHYFGHVTDAEVMEGNQIAEADPRFDTLRYVINDFTGCHGFSSSPAGVKAIAAVDGAAWISNPDIRIAIVAAHPEVIAASETYANSPFKLYPTRLFQSVEQAREWLQATPPNSGDRERR